MADERKRNGFDLAATLAAKAAGKAAAAAMDERLVPFGQRLENIDRSLADIGRRLSEEGQGPTLTLEELTQVALEEMKSKSSTGGATTG